MSRRRSGDTIEPEAGPDAPSEVFEAPSAFDIGQDLLQAALEEVRTSPSDPTGAPAAHEATPLARPRRNGRRRAEGSDATAPAELLDGGTSAGRRRSRRPAHDRPAPTERASDIAMLAPIGALEAEADRIRRGSGAGETDLDASLSIEALEEEADRTRHRSPVAPTDREATDPEVPVVAPAVSPEPERPRQRSRPTPAPTPAPAPAPRASSRRPWVALVAVLAVVVVGVAAVIALTAGGSDEPAPTSAAVRPDGVRLEFDPVTTTEGATVDRVWQLQGSAGNRFVGTLSFSNPTSVPLVATHTEVIPKSLASSVADIDFEPAPTILEADPVVQYSVTVPPGGTVTVRYEVAVAADGVARRRLAAWARDAQEASRARAKALTTTTTAPPETTTTAPPTTTPPTMPVLPPPPPAPAPANAAIVVRTVSQGTTGTFGYSGPGGSASLSTSGSQKSVQSAPIPLAAGTHSWTQVSAPPGSGLVGVGCSDGSTGSGATATFSVQPGQTVVCTWTNG